MIQEKINTFSEFMKLPDGTPLVPIDLYDWLIDTEFFKKPAAIKWHGNYSGGLFDHSLAVARTLVNMTKDLKLKWQNERSPYIIGMFHDMCKVDDYCRVPHDRCPEHLSKDGQWTYNNNKILTGHGDKSVMLLSQFINLTEEELFCIRFHMGAYEKESWNEYDRAIRAYENVLWTHSADMYASKVLDC